MGWLFRIASGLALMVLVAYGVLQFDGPFRKSEKLWAMPWDQVKIQSEMLCRKITKGNDDSFVVCMSIERDSHAILQTSFGLPEDKAAALKRRCAEFQYFTPQLRCVESRLRDGTIEN